VGATGLIEYAPENLILYSNNVADAAWTKADGTITSSAETINGLTAEVFNENSANAVHRFFRMHDGFAGVISTFSVWLKAAGRRYVSVNLGANGPNTNSKLVLDLVDRVVIAGTTGVTTSILLENNGWARYSFTFVPRVNSGSMPIQSNFSSTVVSENGVGLNGAAFYVAGQQYERASIARAYIPTTTAAVYGPRFDHDTASPFACRGLLIEEQRANLLTWSEEFNNTSAWAQTLGFATANQTTSPSGNNDADLLSARNTAFGGILRRAVAPAYAANTTYTMSVYAKAGTHQFIGLRLSTHSAGGGLYSVFTLSGSGSAAAPTPASGTINSVSCVSAGGGWYRCTLIYTTGSTAPNNTTDIAICQSNGNTNFTPAGTETVYLWGAQLEVGDFPTSYIPTTTGTVTRSADVCSITGSAFSGFWNQSEGSLFADSTHVSSPTATTVMANSGANSNQIAIFRVPPSMCRFGVASGGSYSVSEDFSITSNQSVKVIGAYSSASSRAALNGNLSGLDTSVVVPTNLTRLNIGSVSLASAEFANGHIAAIRYFRKRLPDAKLQSLTAP
jgi:hypothetical protein